MTTSAHTPDASVFVEQTANGTSHRIVLSVDNIHCAACIARVEGAMRAEPGVTHARLNFSTRRLTIEWQGPGTRANNFVTALATLGYPARPFEPDRSTRVESDSAKTLLFYVGVAGFAMANIMLLSLGVWITNANTMGTGTRDLLHWLSALIAIPAVFIAGRPFFASAFRALSHRTTNMDVPISVGLILTIGMSLFELSRHGEHAYFDSAVMLMFFLLIGRYFDALVRARARGAAGDLLRLMATTATIIKDNTPHTIAAKDITVGMTILVTTGERIPADGTVISGTSDLDISMITGETRPITVHADDTVVSGAINLSAPLTILTTHTTDQSFLSKIVRLIETAEQAQARYVRIADRAARLYTPIVHILAAAAFLGWVFLGGMVWQDALLIAATVLIITCPCALGLAVPVVQVLAVSHLMKRGVMVKSGDALERLARIDTAVFDKTGTLTTGTPQLATPLDPDIFIHAASLATYSKHPLSRALASLYTGPILSFESITENPGQGVQALLNGVPLRLGRADFCGVDQDVAARAVSAHPDMDVHLWYQGNHSATIFIGFHDVLRNDTAQTLSSFRAQNIDIQILSGDTQERAKAIGDALNVPTTMGGFTPQNKYNHVQSLTANGHRVLMVGDGLNDAPVLSVAYVSMSPSTALAITQNAADIVFTGEKLNAVYDTWVIARRTDRLVNQNFALAIVYNALAIPLAVAGLVTPLVAALAMSGSSLIVIANSYRVKRGT
jgi:Cu2+-exporting ATPase